MGFNFFLFSRLHQPYHKILRVQATTNPPRDIELDRDVNRKKFLNYWLWMFTVTRLMHFCSFIKHKKNLRNWSFLFLHKKKQEVKFTCKAFIRNIEADAGWWYRACPQCRSSVQIYNEQAWCNNCDALNDLPVYWWC